MEIIQTPQKPLLQLIRRSASYKLNIPEKVERKIRYLLQKFPNTEWSGILFYTYTGLFEDGSLQIECQDIYPMDLGTSVWTEFEMNADVAAYIADNIELFECEIGLVHSHHNMDAFFSSQDIKTLQLEGNDTNCFLSLIVNTKGDYKAAITRKITDSKIIKEENKSYEFFGMGKKEIKYNTSETKAVQNTYIEYFMLDITVEQVKNSLAYLDDRFEEIKTKKNKPQVDVKTITCNTPILPFTDKGSDYDLDNWEPDATIIHKLLAQLLTGSMIISENIDLLQWTSKLMSKRFDEIFPDEDHFTQWAEFMVDYLITQYVISIDNISDSIDIETIIASALLEEMDNYPNNKYIEQFKDVLLRY